MTDIIETNEVPVANVVNETTEVTKVDNPVNEISESALVSDALPMPDNLADLKATNTFQDTYDKHTVNALRASLDSLNVAYNRSDDKSDLTWRYMNAVDIPFVNNEPAPEEAPPEDIPEVDQIIPSPDSLMNHEEDQAPKPNPPEQPPTDVATPKPVDPNEIRIENTGAHNVYEPASRTLLVAKEITTIKITPKVDKDKVLRNIEQMNFTRGKTLKIL